MELTQLRYFQKVATLQHMSKAADQLFISQPSLSLSMKKLEDEFGAPLFEKNGRNIDLSEYGIILLDKVTKALEILDEAHTEIDELKTKYNNNLAIGTLSSYSFPWLVASILNLFPDVSITHNHMTIDKIIENLSDEKLDIAITPCPLFSQDISSELMIRCPNIIISSDNHELSEKDSLSVSDISNQIFMSNTKGSHSKEKIDQVLLDSNIRLNFKYESDCFEETVKLCSMSQFMMICSLIRYEMVIKEHFPNIKYYKIEDFDIISEYYISYNNQALSNPVKSKILSFIKDCFMSIDYQLKSNYPELNY